MIKLGLKYLVILVLALSVVLPVFSQEAPAEPTMESLGELMNNKSLENCEKAIKGYEKFLAKDPNNVEALIQIANAYISLIDIKTSALIVEKSELKPILRKLGTLANQYATRAYKLKPIKKEVLAVNLVSYGYLSASYGVVKAVFKGAAGKYKEWCKKLNQADETYLGALGYRSLAKLYHIAPWPVGSSKKALKYFQQAQTIDDNCLYTHYYLGELYFDKDKFDLAETEFNIVIDREAAHHEAHFIDAYKASAKKYLVKIKKERED